VDRNDNFISLSKYVLEREVEKIDLLISYMYNAMLTVLFNFVCW